jgi:hypothetical protein
MTGKKTGVVSIGCLSVVLIPCDSFVTLPFSCPSLAETKGQKKIREEAETLTKAQIDVIHMALIYLSDRCDGAQAEDGQGFNKFDTRLGKELAARDELTPKQAAMGRKLVIKYGGQLRDEIVAAAKGESK